MTAQIKLLNRVAAELALVVVGEGAAVTAGKLTTPESITLVRLFTSDTTAKVTLKPPVVGLTNSVIVILTCVPLLKFPEVSLTVRSGAKYETLHVAPAGVSTAHAGTANNLRLAVVSGMVS
jgi:hypothetical protein